MVDVRGGAAPHLGWCLRLKYQAQLVSRAALGLALVYIDVAGAGAVHGPVWLSSEQGKHGGS